MFSKRSVLNPKQPRWLLTRARSLSHLKSDYLQTAMNSSKRVLICFIGLCAVSGPCLMPASGENPLDVSIVFVKEQLETKLTNSYAQIIYNTRYRPTSKTDIYELKSGTSNPINLTNTGSDGAATDPEISYDGTKMLYARRVGAAADSYWRLHEYIFDTGVDTPITGPGTLDHGCFSNDPDNQFHYDDVDPCYLPNGKIVFTSNRPGTLNEYEMQLNEVLHIMDPLTGEVRQLSFFLSGDYNPAVLHDGRLYWMRYEHVGRLDFFPLMAARPDGSHVEEFFGFKSPVKSFTEFTQLPEPDGRVISTASWHFFTYMAGGLVAVDPREGPVDENLEGYGHEKIQAPYDPDDGGVVDLTPEIPSGIDEGEDGSEKSRIWNSTTKLWETQGRYRTPCAIYTGAYKGQLLASYAFGQCAQYKGSVQSMTDITDYPDFGIYLLGFDPNTGLIVREHLVYNDNSGDNKSSRPIADLDARPVEPRPMPRDIKSYYNPDATEGVFTCMNVYDNSLDYRAFYPEKLGKHVRVRETDPDHPCKPLDNDEIIEAGEISAVRIIENLNVYAEGNTHRRLANYHHEPSRILGEVPVYADGSFKVKVPTQTALHFQTLDEHGRVLSTQLTSIYLQPGENKMCVGCHEAVAKAPTNKKAMPEAAKHPAVELVAPEKDMVHFTRDIQPILHKHCATANCHDSDEPKGELDLSDDVATIYDTAFNSLVPWTRPTSIRKSELMRMMTGCRKIGTCGMPMAPYHIYSNSNANATTTFTDTEWELLCRWIELGVMFRYRADGQVASPFTLAEATAQIENPILTNKCMSAACHGNIGAANLGWYRGAQSVFYLVPRFSDSGGGPVIPIERAINLTHPDRSRLLRAPFMSNNKAGRAVPGWTQNDRNTAFADFLQYGCGTYTSASGWCHPANQLYYLNVAGSKESFSARLNTKCWDTGVSAGKMDNILNWLSEFAGNEQQPTCPTVWDENDQDYIIIQNFIRDAATEFVGEKNPATATTTHCSACHAASKYTGLTKSKAEWKAIVMRMLGQEHKFGFQPEASWNNRQYIMFAPEAAIIGQYLAETHGPELAVEPDTQNRTADALHAAARVEQFNGNYEQAEDLLRKALLASPAADLEQQIRIDLGRIYTQGENFYIDKTTGKIIDSVRHSRPPEREYRH